MSKCRTALLLSVVVSLPLFAFANSASFQNHGGMLTSNGSSLTLQNSTLNAVTGFNGGSVFGNLGQLSFTTGALMSGSLAAGGTFAAGGSFMVMGNGSHGMPSGVLFNGTFSSPVTWTAVFNPTGGPNHTGNWTYKLTGTVTGTFSNGKHVTAQFVAFTFDVPKGAQFSGSVRFNSGSGSVAVPEPGTLALMGTGLIGLAYLGFRKRAVRT
jgi:hypothetical protein